MRGEGHGLRREIACGLLLDVLVVRSPEVLLDVAVEHELEGAIRGAGVRARRRIVVLCESLEELDVEHRCAAERLANSAVTGDDAEGPTAVAGLPGGERPGDRPSAVEIFGVVREVVEREVASAEKRSLIRLERVLVLRTAAMIVCPGGPW
jgi:hypothetical protein